MSRSVHSFAQLSGAALVLAVVAGMFAIVSGAGDGVWIGLALGGILVGLGSGWRAFQLVAKEWKAREVLLNQAQSEVSRLALPLRAAGQGSRDGCVLLRADGAEVCWWNPAFAEFGQFTENDLPLLTAEQIMKRVAKRFADSGRFLEWCAGAETRLEEGPARLWNLRQPEDGCVRVTAVPVTDEAGEGLAVLWRFEDHSEEVQLQRKAADVERADVIESLTTGIAHEFNRILARIVAGFSVLEQSHTPAERTKAIAQARSAAAHAATMCHGLLAYSRAHLMDRRLIGARSLLLWLKGQLAERLGPEYGLKIEIPEKSLQLTVDRNRIRAVLLELCGNAIHAMPQGGTLRVCAEPLRFEGEPDPARFVCFAVEDSGIGIPDGIRERMFEPFFTTNPSANGMGLSAVAGIVWQHGGWITCSSQGGHGTTMRVYLPMAQTVASPEEPEIPDEPFVLVVEDDDVVRRLNQAILRKGGFPSAGVCDAHEAMTVFREHHERVALVLLDLRLPGMSGVELFRRLRREGWSVPIVAVSAHPMDFDTCGLELGDRPCAFVQKPFQAMELLDAVQNALKGTARQELLARASA